MSEVESPSYIQKIQSVSELLQYPADTALETLGSRNIVATKELAATMGVAPRSHWCCISALRRHKRNKLAICWADVYVLRKYRGIEDVIGTDSRPVYSIIEQTYGEPVRSVEIDLRAEILSDEHADALEVPHGSPALTIVRRYTGRKRVFEVSVIRHPAERFTYSLSMHRDWSAGP